MERQVLVSNNDNKSLLYNHTSKGLHTYNYIIFVCVRVGCGHAHAIMVPPVGPASQLWPPCPHRLQHRHQVWIPLRSPET